MSGSALTAAVFMQLVAGCGLDLPPLITPERLEAFARLESGLNPSAVSPPNRDGSRDYGLMQINEQHFRRFRVNARTVMEPCTNLRIGVAILAEADRAAACRYNTGRLSCQNGYFERLAVAATARRAESASRAVPVISPSPSPIKTALGRGATGREFSYLSNR